MRRGKVPTDGGTSQPQCQTASEAPRGPPITRPTRSTQPKGTPRNIIHVSISCIRSTIGLLALFPTEVGQLSVPISRWEPARCTQQASRRPSSQVPPSVLADALGTTNYVIEKRATAAAERGIVKTCGSACRHATC